LFCHDTFYVEKAHLQGMLLVSPSRRASEQIVTLRTPEGREDQDMGSQLVAEEWYHTAAHVRKPRYLHVPPDNESNGLTMIG
jgi:hypothetical protein